MEFGVTTGADIEARPQRAGLPQQAVTGHVLGLADRAGYGAALINAADATVTTWPQFAHTVRTAARGLSQRGLRPGDVVGVLVEDAASHAVAVHCVRAAGAVAEPVPAAAAVADVAAHLKACGARLLITSPALAEVAIQAAERSWVRQVFAFGEAAGTTPFGSLLEAAKHSHRRDGMTGPGGTWSVPDSVIEHALEAAGLTPADASGPGPDGGEQLGSWLTCRDVVVASPPCGDPHAYTALLDLALAAGATIVAAPSGKITAGVRAYKGTAAIVPRGTELPGLAPERVFTVG